MSERQSRAASADAPASAQPPSVKPGQPGKVKTFAELVKFEHSIFALPYAYLGALYGALIVERQRALPLHATIAQFAQMASTIVGYKGMNPWRYVTYAGWPGWWALVWVTVAMVGARSFAFVVNRAVDAEIDARNPRTAGRPIPAGTIERWELWAFSAAVLAAYIGAVYQLSPITHWLWPIPLAFFVVYPYLKRFTWFCTSGWASVSAWVSRAAGQPSARL